MMRLIQGRIFYQMQCPFSPVRTYGWPLFAKHINFMETQQHFDPGRYPATDLGQLNFSSDVFMHWVSFFLQRACALEVAGYIEEHKEFRGL